MSDRIWTCKKRICNPMPYHSATDTMAVPTGFEPVLPAWQAGVLGPTRRWDLIGLTDENRTHNHQNHNLKLYHLSYRQHLVGREGVEPSQSQTADLQSVGLATCSASPYVEGEESNLTPTIHPQVNLVPHIFHKGHIHGFALPNWALPHPYILK